MPRSPKQTARNNEAIRKVQIVTCASVAGLFADHLNAHGEDHAWQYLSGFFREGLDVKGAIDRLYARLTSPIPTTPSAGAPR